MVFLARGKDPEIIEKKKKTDKRKTLKKWREKRLQGKPNNNNKDLWFYLLYQNSKAQYT